MSRTTRNVAAAVSTACALGRSAQPAAALASASAWANSGRSGNIGTSMPNADSERRRSHELSAISMHGCAISTHGWRTLEPPTSVICAKLSSSSLSRPLPSSTLRT
eukprot:233418-Pleurochrysis_carterae.AAC.1